MEPVDENQEGAVVEEVARVEIEGAEPSGDHQECPPHPEGDWPAAKVILPPNVLEIHQRICVAPGMHTCESMV